MRPSRARQLACQTGTRWTCRAACCKSLWSQDEGGAKQSRDQGTHRAEVCTPHTLGVLVEGGGGGALVDIPHLERARIVGSQEAGLEVARPDQAGQLVLRLHLCHGEAPGPPTVLNCCQLEDLCVKQMVCELHSRNRLECSGSWGAVSCPHHLGCSGRGETCQQAEGSVRWSCLHMGACKVAADGCDAADVTTGCQAGQSP